MFSGLEIIILFPLPVSCSVAVGLGVSYSILYPVALSFICIIFSGLVGEPITPPVILPTNLEKNPSLTLFMEKFVSDERNSPWEGLVWFWGIPFSSEYDSDIFLTSMFSACEGRITLVSDGSSRETVFLHLTV